MADFLVQLIEFIVQRCTLTNRVRYPPLSAKQPRSRTPSIRRAQTNFDPRTQLNLPGSPVRFSNRTSGKNRLSLGVLTIGSNSEMPARGLVANGNLRSQVARGFGSQRSIFDRPGESRPPLRRVGCRSCHLGEGGGQDTDGRPDLGIHSVPFRDPGRIIIGKPCDARGILPDQSFQRQVNPRRLD
jgi:hypothetical protein